MKKYEVLFGVMSNITLDVEAENDEQAHEAGWDALNEMSHDDIKETLRNFDFDIITIEEEE
jgi:hypothetical protein